MASLSQHGPFPATGDVAGNILTKVLAGIVLALTCMLAAAAPQDELHAAMMKFLGVQGFHANMTDVGKGQQISTAEFVAPDRFRMVHAEGPQQLVIGGAIYMDMGGRIHIDVPNE